MGTTQGKHATLSKKTLQKIKSQVNEEFTDEEIKTWYDTYNESRKRGQRELTKEEFKQVYKGLFSGDSTEFAEHVFRTFDADRNGTVNFHEFLLGLCVSGSNDPTVKLKWAFSMYDIDGDGLITWAEMNDILTAVCKMTDDAILDDLEKLSPDQQNGDADLDNCLPRDERIKRVTDSVFKEFDTNQDGKISMEEFREGVGKLPIVMNLLGSEQEEGGV